MIWFYLYPRYVTVGKWKQRIGIYPSEFFWFKSDAESYIEKWGGTVNDRWGGHKSYCSPLSPARLTRGKC